MSKDFLFRVESTWSCPIKSWGAPPFLLSSFFSWCVSPAFQHYSLAPPHQGERPISDTQSWKLNIRRPRPTTRPDPQGTLVTHFTKEIWSTQISAIWSTIISSPTTSVDCSTQDSPQDPLQGSRWLPRRKRETVTLYIRWSPGTFSRLEGLWWAGQELTSRQGQHLNGLPSILEIDNYIYIKALFGKHIPTVYIEKTTNWKGGSYKQGVQWKPRTGLQERENFVKGISAAASICSWLCVRKGKGISAGRCSWLPGGKGRGH